MDIELDGGELESFIDVANKWMQELLSGWGVPQSAIIYVKLIVMLIMVVAIVYLLQFIVRYVLSFIFRRVYKITNLSFFKYTLDNRLPHFLALIVPYSFVKGVIPIVFYDFKVMIEPLIKAAEIYLVFMIIWTLMSIIKSCANILENKPAFHNKPMKSYLQVINIILFIFGAVAVFCIFTGYSPKAFFAAMGAASAVLMLMFKDTIMGFVGSIQISTNDMVRIGDWITMNKYGADGDVEEINLTTVKVRNFDKTITTIPTYALISDSFQNWRGMKESGGRRFKRSINLKYDSVRFMSDDELDKFKGIKGLDVYIQRKRDEYKDLNKVIKIDSTLPLNEHRITNVDLFIQYGTNYLKNHPKINPNMTLLVRELTPTTQGLPIELYTFTNTTVWAEYEIILAEIVNHLISVVKYFDLTIYEESSGSDDYNVILKNASAN
jgi:miniconductance mechanosensitive channel